MKSTPEKSGDEAQEKKQKNKNDNQSSL